MVEVIVLWDTVDILGQIILRWGGLPCAHCRMLSSTPVASTHGMPGAPPCPVWRPKMSLDIAKYPVGGSVTPSGEPVFLL